MDYAVASSNAYAQYTYKLFKMHNILLATITNNKLLAAIFPFELEKPSSMSLFSGVALKEKPITIIYTDAKVDDHPIKLILDSGSAGNQLDHQIDYAASTRIITANGVTKTLIGKINNLSIEVNGIIVSIKVLVIKATQYQALVGNDWLFKTNIELQLSQNGQYTRIPYHCRITKKKERKEKNLSRILTNYGGLTMIKVSYQQFGPEKKREKRKKEKTKIHKIPTLHIFHIRHHNHKPITNTLDNQNNKENETMNYVWLVAKCYSGSNPKTYITFSDLSKEQKLRWFSDNNESIMPEYVHNTNTRFDLRYPKKDAIKLEPHSHTCIDFKVALEIPATTMVQLAFKNSLAKKRINIRREIIDAGYVKNIIAMLQNDLEKTYIIESNKKIAQAIFLPLVKIAQLVSV
ncbi:hypothetical protein G9A89_011585 [Geosiphon pyriformis]|nr:hypothetical protein G9A89_011585 [Geosiphon pyriformis]